VWDLAEVVEKEVEHQEVEVVGEVTFREPMG
jgi:hypothetical protein